MILTVQECVDMSELSNEAIRVIAEHEHMPEVVAAELGQELLKSTGGIAEIRRMLEKSVELAIQGGRRTRSTIASGCFGRSLHPIAGDEGSRRLRGYADRHDEALPVLSCGLDER
jgi:hypothetical protein